MQHRPVRRMLPALAGLALALSSCSSSSSPKTSIAPTTTAPTTTAAPLTGSLSVFAAASLTGAFTSAKTTLTATNPGLSITYDFAGSNALVSQIQQGAPADVFASADIKNMQKLVTAGVVD